MAPMTWFDRYVVLNLYAYALGAGAGAAAVLATHVLGESVGAALVLFGAAIVLGVWAGYVASRRAERIRVARILLTRIERKGYRADYFASTCASPCMRLVTRLVHSKVQRQESYRAVVRQHRARPSFFLEHANPEVEALIESGALRAEDVQAAVRQHLRAGAEPVPMASRGSRSMVRVGVSSLLLVLLQGAGELPAVAHGGGLNACGCHFNRKTGECHCHRNRGCGCACESPRCGTGDVPKEKEPAQPKRKRRKLTPRAVQSREAAAPRMAIG